MEDHLGHRDPKHTAHYTRVAGYRFEGCGCKGAEMGWLGRSRPQRAKGESCGTQSRMSSKPGYRSRACSAPSAAVCAPRHSQTTPLAVNCWMVGILCRGRLIMADSKGSFQGR